MKYRKLTGYKYELLSSITADVSELGDYQVNLGYVRIGSGKIWISPHYAWDGPSGPTIDTKSFMRGSVVHDALYQLMREDKLPRTERKVADQILRRHCLEDGMGKFRAWYVFQSLRMFAAGSAKPKKKNRGEVIDDGV